MAKAEGSQKIRFAIGEEQALSETWTAWVNRSDVYMTSSVLKGDLKLSLHASGVCQVAFLPEAFERISSHPLARADRTIRRWRRSSTPTDGPLHVVSLFFTSYDYWPALNEAAPKKPVAWIIPPPKGWALEIGILYSCEDPNDHVREMPTSAGYLARFELENGEFVTLVPRLQKLPTEFFDFQRMPGVFMTFGDYDANCDTIGAYQLTILCSTPPVRCKFGLCTTCA